VALLQRRELKGRSGSKSQDLTRKKRRIFLLKFDRPRVDDAEIYANSNSIGAPYWDSVANVTDLSALLESISYDQSEENPYWFKVTEEYSTTFKKDEQPEDPENPASRPPKIDVGTWFKTKLIEKAKLLSANGTPGSLGLMLNSYGDPYKDPPSDERGLDAFMITFYATAQFNGKAWRSYRGSTNESTFKGYPARTLLVRDQKQTTQYENGKLFYECYMEILHDPDGFDKEILDAGTRCLINGKRVNDANAFNDVASELILLDGSGNAIVNPTPAKAVYRKYRYKAEKDFSSSTLAISNFSFP
jgi:hypothetical protein